jgi:ariadne-1
MYDNEDDCNEIINEDYYMYDKNDLGNSVEPSTNEVDFLEETEIIKEREKIIEEAIEKLFLGRDDAILAMIYLEWQENKIESWYDNVDENKFKSGIELSPKTKDKLKKEGIESNGENCLVCFEEKNNDFFSLNCGHQFCPECWTEYLNEKIKSPLSALQAKCPQNGCTCIVYERIYRKFLKDNQSLSKLDKAIYKNYINRNKDIRQCPNEKCKYYAKSSVHSYSQEINCPCGTSYCFQCLKESHRPCTCELIDKFIGLNRNTSLDDYDKRWIEANTKECPHCHQKIQKSQGCNYMLCDKRAGGCGKAFCYVCETDWDKHSKDHFNCNKYTEAVKQKEANAKKVQKDLDLEIKKYERYDFYYPRYMNYKQSVEVCKTTFKKSLEEKVQLLNFIHELPTIETKFIFDALETIINAKRTLKNTYIFGYYMKDSINKKLFEHSQGILEFTTENLHQQLLEQNLNHYIELEKSYFLKYFPEFKGNVNQKIITINKYRKSLLEEIENKYIDDLDSKIINLKFK